MLKSQNIANYITYVISSMVDYGWYQIVKNEFMTHLD
jgi:hypothetical protein